MNTDILSKDKDPMGAAILDYQKSGKAGRLRVLSSMFEEDEMPVKHLFRKVEEMPNAGSLGLTVSGAMLFGLIALMFLDTSINMAMQPFNMLVGDMVNEKQKAKA